MAQPPSRTRFYLDRGRRKLMGVCSGIADYTGFDVTLVRVAMVMAVFIASPIIVLGYLLVGWIAEDKPRELVAEDPEARRFWQAVRASPSRSARDIRSRLREINRRLADIETYVTSDNHSLAREIERLRDR